MISSDRPRVWRVPSKGILIGVGVIGVVVALGLWFFVVSPVTPLGSNILTYCGGEGTAQHYHPLLVINDNSAQQPLPYDKSQSADIGYINQPGFTNPSLYCPGGEIHALHTHDGSGIVHVELPTSITSTPTLGNFFQIWGEPLSPSQVWTFSGTVKATVLDYHTGHSTDYSSNPGGILLYAPFTGPVSNPYPIPSTLIFNGAYGNGQSGGFFSGEIIYLNITLNSAAIAFLSHPSLGPPNPATLTPSSSGNAPPFPVVSGRAFAE